MNKNMSRTYDSAVSYELVSYAGTPSSYKPSEGRFFKGLLVSVAGNLQIIGTGAEDVAVTFPVTPGLYPFAGSRIIEAGTTATIAVVLF
jgi:hypothetical protein